MLQRFVDSAAIAAEIARVRSLSGGALRRRWQAVFGRSVPEHLIGRQGVFDPRRRRGRHCRDIRSVGRPVRRGVGPPGIGVVREQDHHRQPARRDDDGKAEANDLRQRHKRRAFHHGLLAVEPAIARGPL
jgi:hypothetical protein